MKYDQFFHMKRKKFKSMYINIFYKINNMYIKKITTYL